MSNIKSPIDDRIRSDFHEGPNPDPGGEIDTAENLVPLLDRRSTSWL